jgi:TolA-binding protein
MKSINLLLIAGFVLLISCGGNNEKKQMQEKVSGLENNLLADSLGPVDRLKAQELIQEYENFASAYPDDSLAPEYLYRGGELAMNLQMSGRAVQSFQQIISSYPDFDKAALCIFLQAFVYENQMQQYDAAKKLYRDFLEKYPDHELAEDALVSIQNMGKSLEELIKSWEE